MLEFSFIMAMLFIFPNMCVLIPYILFILLMLLIGCTLQPIGWWESKHLNLCPPEVYSPKMGTANRQNSDTDGHRGRGEKMRKASRPSLRTKDHGESRF